MHRDKIFPYAQTIGFIDEASMMDVGCLEPALRADAECSLLLVAIATKLPSSARAASSRT